MMPLEYDGDDLKVVAIQSVKMTVPAFDDRYGVEGRSCFARNGSYLSDSTPISALRVSISASRQGW
jgi:hypothetical protein